MNLAEILHENLEKNHRLDSLENGEIEVPKAESEELWNWWIEHTDDLTDALMDAGILVMGAYSPFPHPEWLYRLPQLGLCEEDTQAIIDYVHEHWSESLMLLDDIEADGIERAITASAKRCKQKGIVFSQPDAALSTIETENTTLDTTLGYHRFVVVLRNVNGELARYEPFCKRKDQEYAGFGLRYVESLGQTVAA